MHRLHICRAGAALAVALASHDHARGAAAHPLLVTFERIADRSTTFPGSLFTFTSFGLPSIDSDDVAFNGDSFNAGSFGIHLASRDVLQMIVDINTQIPGEPPGVTFITLTAPSLRNGRIAFGGAYNVGSTFWEGVLVWNNGSLDIVAHDGDPVPDRPGHQMIHFFTASMSEDDLGFASFTSMGAALFSTRDGLHTLANVLTIVPGTQSTFSNFCPNPTFDDGEMAFCGYWDSGASSGVLRADEASVLSMIARNGWPAPGGGTFTAFDDSPTIRNGRVAFRAASTAGIRGIYLATDSGIDLVANTMTPIPGGSGSFIAIPADYDGPALNDCGRVAFYAFGPGNQSGVYTTVGGRLNKVIAAGDQLDDRTVAAVFVGREGFSRNRIAMNVAFTDGWSGIYVATVSIPADVNRDGQVNVSDLLSIISSWGSCPGPCPPTCNADINQDCTVNVSDLLQVINAWGECP